MFSASDGELLEGKNDCFFVSGIDFIGITTCVQILDASFSPLNLRIILIYLSAISNHCKDQVFLSLPVNSQFQQD